MNYKLNIILVLILSWICISCEKKPEACLALDETLESGTFLTLNSCSRDFEFLTWEYSDGVGTVGDLSQRTFDYEGTVAVRLTAYSDGGYKSDDAEQTVSLSYRYIDYFEVTGKFNYEWLSIEFDNDESWYEILDTSEYIAGSPLAIESWPIQNYVIEPNSIAVTLIGNRESFSGDTISEEIISKRFNFEVVKDNPIHIESSNGKTNLDVYWRWRFN